MVLISLPPFKARCVSLPKQPTFPKRPVFRFEQGSQSGCPSWWPTGRSPCPLLPGLARAARRSLPPSFLRHTKMKTATNIYIFNLALADTLVLLTLPFQGTDVLLGFWPFGNALCKAVIAIDYYNMFTSTFTLTAMSVDRYVAICHPIRALDVRTSSKAQAVNVAIWALASLVGVPVAVMGSAQIEDEGQ